MSLINIRTIAAIVSFALSASEITHVAVRVHDPTLGNDDDDTVRLALHWSFCRSFCRRIAWIKVVSSRLRRGTEGEAVRNVASELCIARLRLVAAQRGPSPRRCEEATTHTHTHSGGRRRTQRSTVAPSTDRSFPASNPSRPTSVCTCIRCVGLERRRRFIWKTRSTCRITRGLLSETTRNRVSWWISIASRVSFQNNATLSGFNSSCTATPCGFVMPDICSAPTPVRAVASHRDSVNQTDDKTLDFLFDGF